MVHGLAYAKCCVCVCVIDKEMYNECVIFECTLISILSTTDTNDNTTNDNNGDDDKNEGIAQKKKKKNQDI